MNITKFPFDSITNLNGVSPLCQESPYYKIKIYTWPGSFFEFIINYEVSVILHAKFEWPNSLVLWLRTPDNVAVNKMVTHVYIKTSVAERYKKLFYSLNVA